jgi:hypothetical protein
MCVLEIAKVNKIGDCDGNPDRKIERHEPRVVKLAELVGYRANSTVFRELPSDSRFTLCDLTHSFSLSYKNFYFSIEPAHLTPQNFL